MYFRDRELRSRDRELGSGAGWNTQEIPEYRYFGIYFDRKFGDSILNSFRFKCLVMCEISMLLAELWNSV